MTVRSTRPRSPGARLTILLAAISLGACGGAGDVTKPPDPLGVSLHLNYVEDPVISETPDGPVISCAANITVAAEGTGTASWGSAWAVFSIGPDRSVRYDSVRVGRETVVSIFGGNLLHAHETRTIEWTFQAGAPFDLYLKVDYVPGEQGPGASAETHFTCGPQPTGGPVPTIDSVRVHNDTPALLIGRDVGVYYTASSPSGLWVTIIETEGAFTSSTVVSEMLEGSASRGIPIRVPNDVVPDEPLRVTVWVLDPFLRYTSRALTTEYRMGDAVRPTITAATLQPLHGPAGFGLTGRFAVGDTMSLRVSATDDVDLGWVVYEIAAPVIVRDSVPAPARTRSFDFDVPIVVQPGWEGTPTMSVYVRDRSGQQSGWFSSPTNGLWIYPTVARPVAATTYSEAYAATDVAYDPRRETLYFATTSPPAVIPLDVATMTWGAAIPLPAAPQGLDVTRSGDSLVVTQRGEKSLAIVDLTAAAAVSVVRLEVLDTAGTYAGTIDPSAAGVRVAANGKAIVVLDRRTRSGDQVIDLDLSTGRSTIRVDAHGTERTTGWPGELAAADDRSKVVLFGTECPRIYTAVSDSFSACNSVFTDNFGLTLDADASTIAAGPLILDASFRVLHTLQFGASRPVGALTPDATVAYYPLDGGVVAVRLADEQWIERIPLPAQPHQRRFVTPDGKWLLLPRLDRVGAMRVELQ